MPTILHNADTGNFYEAKDDQQVAALAKRGWKPVEKSSVSKDELHAQAKAAGVSVDPKATREEVAKKLANHGES